VANEPAVVLIVGAGPSRSEYPGVCADSETRPAVEERSERT